jgi:hypothetical protein
MTEEEQRQQAAQDAIRAIMERGQGAERSRSEGTPESNAAVSSIVSRMPEDQRPKTWAETGEDIAKSVGSGLVKGTTALADAPDFVGSTNAAAANWVAKNMFGSELSPSTMHRIRSFGIPGVMGNPIYSVTGQNVTGHATDYAPDVMGYEPKTDPGKYLGKGAEFVPGAVFGPGNVLKNVVVQGIIPGLASEAAGQMTEGTKYEPYARFAGALTGGIGANMLENGLRGAISPGGGAAADDLAHAARLRAAGTDVSAGQATKSPNVLAIEANNPVLQSRYNVSDSSPQLMDFTTSILKEAGLTDDIAARAAAKPGFIGNPYTAQPQVMSELRASNGALFDAALNGVNIVPLRRLTAPIYKANSMKGAPTAIQDAVDLIGDAARRGTTVPARELHRVRSELGKELSSLDYSRRDAAEMARDAIDDMIDSAASPDQIDLLNEARRQHQAILVAEYAVKNGTPRGANGIITPADLAGGLKAIYGNKNVTIGNVNRMGDLAQSGLRTLTDLGKSTRSRLRSALPFAELSGGVMSGLGAAQGAAFLGAPPTVAALAAGLTTGAAAIDAARRGARGILEANAHRPIVQKYLQNQLVNPTSGRGWFGSGVRGAVSGVPTYSTEGAGPQADGGRIVRKSGGRVSSHEADADQLVRAAERAKKGWSAKTEPLLNQSDEAVAKALEVANRSI